MWKFKFEFDVCNFYTIYDEGLFTGLQGVNFFLLDQLTSFMVGLCPRSLFKLKEKKQISLDFSL